MENGIWLASKQHLLPVTSDPCDCRIGRVVGPAENLSGEALRGDVGPFLRRREPPPLACPVRVPVGIGAGIEEVHADHRRIRISRPPVGKFASFRFDAAEILAEGDLVLHDLDRSIEHDGPVSGIKLDPSRDEFSRRFEVKFARGYDHGRGRRLRNRSLPPCKPGYGRGNANRGRGGRFDPWMAE